MNYIHLGMKPSTLVSFASLRVGRCIKPSAKWVYIIAQKSIELATFKPRQRNVYWAMPQNFLFCSLSAWYTSLLAMPNPHWFPTVVACVIWKTMHLCQYNGTECSFREMGQEWAVIYSPPSLLSLPHSGSLWATLTTRSSVTWWRRSTRASLLSWWVHHHCCL